jgi:hypothetical protein
LQEAVKGTDPKDIVNNLLKPKADSTKKDSTKTPKATEQLTNKLNSLLKKKKN